jgi:hypothetical protein
MNTEEQAKAKWCPFGNRDDGDNPVTFCIASECMAWRVEKGDAESDGAGNWLPVGYCGLAGQP